MKKCLVALFLFAGLGRSISFAQHGIVDCIQQRKLVVAHVRGQFFDHGGVPVPGARVSLWPDGKPIIQSKANETGEFSFKVEPRHYILKATYPGFEITTAELDVGADLFSTFHPTALRVILALPGLNCPWVTTSNKEFKGLVKTNVTQR